MNKLQQILKICAKLNCSSQSIIHFTESLCDDQYCQFFSICVIYMAPLNILTFIILKDCTEIIIKFMRACASPIIFLFASWIYNIEGYYCPLINYENSIVQRDHVEIFEKEANEQLGIGFWSTFALFRNSDDDTTIQQGMMGIIIDGIINYEQTFIYGAEVPTLESTIRHQFIGVANNEIYTRQNFNFQSNMYEGFWIFHYLIFHPNTSQYQLIVFQIMENGIMGQSAQFEYRPYSGTGIIRLALQGKYIPGFAMHDHTAGKYTFQQTEFYPGLLSKFIVIKDGAYRENMGDYLEFFFTCSMPRPPFTIDPVIEDPVLLDIDNRVTKTLNVKGNRYAVKGWVRFDRSKINILESGIFNVFQLSINEKPTGMNIGDFVFKMIYYIRLQHASQLKFLQTNAKYPVKGPYKNSDDDQFSYIISQPGDELYHWHFVQAEYGRNLYWSSASKTLLIIYFPFNGVYIQRWIGAPGQGIQFGNCKMFLSFASRDVDSKRAKVSAILSKFSFVTLDSDFVQPPDCHYSCQFCSGPTASDCLSCPPNRYLIIGRCECPVGQYEYLGDIRCKDLILDFKDALVFSSAKQDFAGCPQGYFQLKGGCKQCPFQIQQLAIQCLDCHKNYESWQHRPICTQDLKREGIDFPFIYSERDQDQTTLYLISDDDKLLECVGCLSFIEDDQCLGTLRHLGKCVSVQCKENYFQIDDMCQIPVEFCSKQINRNCVVCQKSFYLSNVLMGKCIKCPDQCDNSCKEENGKVICLACRPSYGLVDGNCVKCGRQCEYCELTMTVLGEILQCLRCNSPELYFPSLNQIDCLNNNLPNCIYPVQFIATPDAFITLYDRFNPQQDYQTYHTLCGYCNPNQFYMDFFLKCEGMNQFQQTLPTCDVFSTETGKCLIGENNDAILIRRKCYQFDPVLEYCSDCHKKSNEFETPFCTLCFKGYYSHDGECRKCPKSLNCATCARQHKKKKDLWKIWIRPYLEGALLKTQLSPSQFVESLNDDDYEIICTTCESGLMILNGQCIELCGQGCESWIIQGNQCICLRCVSQQNGRMMTFFQNRCIQCPEDCEVCVPRETTSIEILNPFFSNAKFSRYSHVCLTPKSEGLQFDSNIRQYRGVSSFLKLELTIRVYCSKAEFESLFDKAEQKVTFLRTNVLYEDLFSEAGLFLEDFEFESMYSELNSKHLQTIIVRLQITGTDAICGITQNQAKFTSFFFKNVFSLQNLHLHILGPGRLNLPQSLTIDGFNQILFQDIEIFAKSRIIIQSLKQVHLILTKFSITGNGHCLQFDFKSQLNLIIKELRINDLNCSFQDVFIATNPNSRHLQLEISDIIIKKSLFNQSNFFITNSDYLLTLKGFLIDNSRILQSKIISSSQKVNSRILIDNIEIINSNFSKCEGFIHTEPQLTIYNFIVNKILLQNSQLIVVRGEISLNNLTIQQSKILQNSTLILQTGDTSVHLYSSINFIRNLNDLNSSFLLVNITQHGKSFAPELRFNNLAFFENAITDFDFSSDSIGANSERCLLNLVAPSIIIENVIVSRAINLNEICMSSTGITVFKNMTVSLAPQLQKQLLHFRMDCSMINNKEKIISAVIKLNSGESATFSNMVFLQNQLFSSLLILNQLDEATQATLIRIENSMFSNNILVQTRFDRKVSLIFLNQPNMQMIELSNVSFINNLRHDYDSSQKLDSPSLLFLHAPFSAVFMKQLSFINNTALLTNNTLLNIESNNLTITNSVFHKNMLFSYDLLTPYLIWGFEKNINQDDLKTYFPIKAFQGIGKIIVTFLQVSNSIFNHTYGQYAGVFQIDIRGKGLIRIERTKFYNIHYSYNEQSYKGALLVDAEESELQLFIINCEANNIKGYKTGAFFYLVPSQGKHLVHVKQTSFVNIAALQGSILYVNFQLRSNNEILMENCSFRLDSEFYLQYLQENQIQFTKQMSTSIYVSNGNLTFRSILLSSFSSETLLYLENPTALLVENILYEGAGMDYKTLKNQLIFIDSTVFQSKVILDNIRYSSIQFVKNLSGQLCLEKKKTLIQSLYQCQEQSHSLPQQLDLAEDIIRPCDQQHASTNSIISIIFSGDSYPLILLRNIRFEKILCAQCEFGLIYIQVKEFQKIRLNSLLIQGNQCGTLGCIVVSNSSLIEPILKRHSGSRLLINSTSIALKAINAIELTKFKCENNIATFGPCLFINNQKLMLTHSTLIANAALELGGAIFHSGIKEFWIQHSIVMNNTAVNSAGIHMQNGFLLLNASDSQIIDNIATNFGDNLQQAPVQLKIKIKNNQPFLESDKIQIDQTIYDQIRSQYLLLPSGIPISEYYVYDEGQDILIPSPYLFRLTPTDKLGQAQIVNSSSFCNISAKIVTNYSLSLFPSNILKSLQIFYDVKSKSYEFDDLAIYLDPAFSATFVNLKIWCSSIQIPIYNNDEFSGYHSDYFLNLNIKVKDCTIGQVKHQQFGYCVQCDPSQDQYSLDPQSTRCEIRNEQIISQINIASLRLRPGYWRPNARSNQIEECVNQRENCLGEWKPGDYSCSQGHIGALCEECDNYNIRGFGSYSISKQYTCSLCYENNKQVAYIILIGVWTFLSISITIDSVVEQSNDKFRSRRKAALSTLIKILTNYLQIFASLTTFQLSYSTDLNSVVSSLGNPIQTFIYSLDCFLVENFPLSIIYSRILWQIIMPIIYILLVILLKWIYYYLYQIYFQTLIWTTTIIYSYLYFNPNISQSLLSVISYREIANTRWIQGNVSIEYNQGSHKTFVLAIFLPILFITVMLIPCVVLFFLHRNRNQLAKYKVQQYFGYLYIDYKQSKYYWEVVKQIQKQLISALQIFFQDQIAIKGILIYLCLLFYSQLTHHHSPYSQFKFNRLDRQSSYVLGYSIILGVLTYQAQVQKINGLAFFGLTNLLLLNLYFFLNIIYMIITAYCKEIDLKLDIVREKVTHLFPRLMQYAALRSCLESRRQRSVRIRLNFQKIRHHLILISRKTLIDKISSTRFGKGGERGIKILNERNPLSFKESQRASVNQLVQAACQSQEKEEKQIIN